MSRSDSAVPVVLWLCAAAVVHYATYRGADVAAGIGLDKMDLRGFVSSVRSGFSGTGDPLEVTFEAVKDEPKPAEPPPVPDDKVKPDEKQKPADVDRKKTEPPKDKPKTPPKEVKEDKEKPKPKEPPRIKLPEVKLDPPKPEPPKPEAKKEEKPPEPQKLPDRPKATAVDQHVEDKNQKPNPDADKIAEHNNKVKEESQARITNNRVNDKDTNPGATTKGDDSAKDPGNAEKSKIADVEDKAGTKKAPGDSAKADKASESKSAAKDSDKADAKPVDKASPKEGNDGKSGPKGPAQDARAPQDVKPSEDKAPNKGADAVTGDKGTYSLNPFAKDAKALGSASAANSAAPPVAKKDAPYSIPKLGGGPGPNGVNFNLSPGGALAVFGEGALKKERELDGERRKSAHRGKWKPSGLDRIKQQIENYVAHVKLGDTTALNTASVPFAKYLNHIHNQLHPIFADEFLSSLDGLPNDHPANNQKIRTVLEVVIDKDSGRILESGIVKTSGVTMFDLAALDAMDRAAPFGKPPEAILSPDGKVYLHWEFHRAPEIACTTHHAFPFILKEAPNRPAPQKPLPGPRVPLEPRERTLPVPSREGRREDADRPHEHG